MLAFNIIAASLLCTGFVKSQPQHVNTVFLNSNELKGTLDWLHKFSKHYEGKKEKYKELGEIIMNDIGLPHHVEFVEILDGFIRDACELREALVKGDAEDIIISEVMSVSVLSLRSSVLLMKDCFNILKSHITEWEKDSKGKLSDIKTTDPKQLLWFTEHGFSETILNSITIEELKERIDNIYGHNTPMYKLLELLGTIFFLAKTNDSSGAYARLDRISGSAEAISLIENHLREKVGMVPPLISTELVESLRELGKEGTPLRKYNEKYDDAYTYQYYMQVLSTSAFTESSVSRYLELLSEICLAIKLEGMQYLVLLKENGGYMDTRAYKKEGTLSFEATSETDFRNKVNFFHGNWQVTRLCEAVKRYEYLVPKKQYGDGTITNLRA